MGLVLQRDVVETSIHFTVNRPGAAKVRFDSFLGRRCR